MGLLNVKIHNSYDKLKLLIIFQFFLVVLSFLIEAIQSQSILNISFLFQLISIIVAFKFYFTALTHLYYSYWNISLLLGIYYLLSILRNFFVLSDLFVSLLYLSSFSLLLISSYVLSSPLYYPRSHWWEYDFRFRADIKCWILIDGRKINGRLSDLRRGAACLELFESFPVGYSLNIYTKILDREFHLHSVIRSRKEPISGRSLIYGVKFTNNDLEEKQRIKFLTHYWKKTKKMKIKEKFFNYKNV